MDAQPPAEARRWRDLRGAAKGTAYDSRWEALAEAGASVHGEADLVWDLLAERRAEDPGRAPVVLDAGCGTGRVVVELARRGADVLGVDRDPDLLASARAKAPDLRWVEADLRALDGLRPPGSVDLAVLAGNVLIFTEPRTEAAVVAAVAGTVRPGGLVVAGFQVRRGGYGPAAYDADARTAGLVLRDRWSTWGREPWSDGDGYQVSVHVMAAPPPG